MGKNTQHGDGYFYPSNCFFSSVKGVLSQKLYKKLYFKKDSKKA